MLEFLDDSLIKDPIITKEILAKLTPAQNSRLDRGRVVINFATGDMIVPIKVSQNQIAKIIVNIF
jgi:hypothetical protein